MRWINELIDAIESIPSIPRQIAAGIGGAIGSAGGVFKQHGGRVLAGMPYIVGERRPEVFIPDRSGTIAPSVSVTGGGEPVDYDRLATAIAQSTGAAVREAIEGLAFYMDADGLVHLVSGRLGRQANLYARGG